MRAVTISGRGLHRGLHTTPPGLERDHGSEFIADHGHAQIGQLCADLRRTCHGAGAALRRVGERLLRASRSLSAPGRRIGRAAVPQGSCDGRLGRTR